MTLRNHIINFIICTAKDENFTESTIDRSAIVSTFFRDQIFTTNSAHQFIQRYWVEIVDFKNNFMADDDTDIFTHPIIFLQHLVRRYAHIILASLTLENYVILDEYFIRKLENLLRI